MRRGLLNIRCDPLMLFFDVLDDLFIIFGLVLAFDKAYKSFDLRVGYKVALYADRLHCASGGIQHVSLSKQLFGSGGVDYRAAVHLGRDRKRDPRWDIRFYYAGYYVDRRPLRCDNKVHSGCARQGGKPVYRFLDLAFGNIHQVCELVYYYYYFGKFKFGCSLLLHQLVKAAEVSDLVVLEQVVTVLHLNDRPVERSGRMLGIGHYRDKQVRYTVVYSEFDHFGINHYHFDLVRL